MGELVIAVYQLFKALIVGFEPDALNDFEAFEAFIEPFLPES